MLGFRLGIVPAAACLSSRVPYGTPVTIETIQTIENGEEAVRALGFRQFRVRFHGELVRIEIAKDELPNALTLEMAGALTAIFKEAWLFVCCARSGRIPAGIIERGAQC